MKLNIKIVQKNDRLEFLVKGKFILEEATEKFKLVIDVCKMTGIRLVLIDYRDLEGIATGIEKTFYAYGVDGRYKNYLRKGGHPLRIAYLGSDNKEMDPGMQFAEITDLPIRVFVDYEKAIAWLNS